MLTLASRCFVAEKITHDRSLSAYQMSLSGFFFTSFEKNVDFFGAEWKSTYSGTPISQSRKTPLTEIFMFPKTSRNPSNWNQHLHGNSKSETKKTPSHLITKTPWTCNNPMNSGTGEIFFLVQASKDSTSSTTSSDIVCKMQPVGSGSLCTDKAVWGWDLF